MKKIGLAHLAVVLWLFEGALFEGRVFFFRDIFCYYFPNYVFLESSLRQGLWPLWNPTADAGAPFLIVDPVDLLLVGLFGAVRALRLALPLHVLLAMCGASALARRLGADAWGSWSAGAFFGLSGFMLSTLNLFELSHGVAWAPWVIWAYLGVFEKASPGRTAALAALAAVQVSTLAGETVAQTALAALVLTPRWPDRRTLTRLVTAAAVACLLSGPALLGVRALMAGTRRAQGFQATSALFYSMRPVMFLEALLPRFFGDVHTFSDAGFWGQSIFAGEFPYLLSLYVGATTLLLAARARESRLWLLAATGVLLALGRYGPLAEPLALAMRSFRSPVKFLFLADLALCLLAGLGVTRASREKGTLLATLPGLVLLVGALVLHRRPVLAALAWLLPEAGDPRAQLVMQGLWPPAFALAGVLCAGAGLALWVGGRLAPAAAVLGAVDLLLVNGGLNAPAPASFYELRPEVRSLVAQAGREGAHGERWFSFGVSPDIRWSPLVARLNRDVWLYYMDRQSLLPRTTTLDGLDAAFDVDRTGWAPPGSTLHPSEYRSSRFPEIADRLRLASVRWVLSWNPLPEGLVALRGEERLPEVESPLHLYELVGARPRAFWSEGAIPRPDPRGSVSYERPDPHTIVLRATSPPGFIVVSEGFHAEWRVSGPEGLVGAVPVDGRYLGFPTPGGDRRYVLHYEPSWRAPALSLAAGGLVLELLLVVAAARALARSDRP